MTDEKQKTLVREFAVEGVGVHSGEAAILTFKAGEPGSGIRFRRVDLEGRPEIPADLDHVVSTELGTTIGKGEARVLTIEHVMAALAAHEVDNALLELTGPEPPIRDGSFLEYFWGIAGAGTQEQEAPARIIEVRESLVVKVEEGASYIATPSDDFRLSVTIEYPHPAIGRQYGSFLPTMEGFGEELAPARTFGFKEDAEALWQRGLAQASSLENTVVLDDRGVMNDKLRFPDEFLRHKTGDMIGDLALLGARLHGHIIADRPSHRGNVEISRIIAEHARRGTGRPILDAREIMEYLPHRFPFLLVDRIIEFEAGRRIVGLKNVTINEPFFQGHYPGHPIMPGVMVIEAMAQVGGLLLVDLVDDPQDKVIYFMSLDNVKWRRPVTPGDQLIFELEMIKLRRTVCKMRGKGFVDGNVVAEADFVARMVDR